ncbi:MAG TPA: type VI secretion system tube protein Hcp [Devosia sp.]|nr:type VI secretion system tube protein Hcp [Devosia sp.]
MAEAVDYFLKITDIKGESKDEKHPDEIQISSFSYGVTNTGSMGAGGGGGSGKAAFNDVHCVAQSSIASPLLLLSCANGTHHSEATLVARKSGGDKLEYLKVTLKDVLVSSYQTGGSGGDVIPMDQFALNFTSIKIDYLPQDAKGKGGGATTAGWDLKKNNKL